MSTDKSIIFTGGGSGGHAIVAITLIDYFREQGVRDILYVGSYGGIERQLASEKDVKYIAISTGKLRRYLSRENLIDIFRVLKGVGQSLYIIFKLKKNMVIFSTGGFVAIPICIAGFLLGKKVYLHEQTSRKGLANAIVAKFAKKVFLTFDASRKLYPLKKIVMSGYPLRKQLFDLPEKPVVLDVDLDKIEKPILFITGGGNGSKFINDLVMKQITSLKDKYFIFHQVGKQFIDDFTQYRDESYIPFDFLSQGISTLMSRSDYIVARSGAGTVCELVALHKKVIFIPLAIAQQNEQYHNAMEAAKKIPAVVLTEQQCRAGTLLVDQLQELAKIESLPRKAPAAPEQASAIIYQGIDW